MNGGWGISFEIALRWMPLDLADDKSTLVQVMAWCRQATSHYLSQCWPRFMSPNGATRPQWNCWRMNKMGDIFQEIKLMVFNLYVTFKFYCNLYSKDPIKSKPMLFNIMVWCQVIVSTSGDRVYCCTYALLGVKEFVYAIFLRAFLGMLCVLI